MAGNPAPVVSVPPLSEPPRGKDARRKANFISRLFFCWVDALFCAGCQHSLVQSDLYTCPSEADSEKLLRNFNQHWQAELQREKLGGNARLWVALLQCFWWRIVLVGVLFCVGVALVNGQSVLVGYLAEYFFSLRDEPLASSLLDNSTISSQLASNQSTQTEALRNAHLFATGLTVNAVVILILFGQAFFSAQKIGMMCRIVAMSAIYQKILSLNQLDIGRVSVGHIVNLATNDVQMFDNSS